MKLPVDPTFQTLAARYLRKQIKQLTGQLDGIRKAEDIEFIHRARVATRRLRAGLKFLADCFPVDRVKTWRKEFRRLARSLGDARDQDVQIAFLCDLLSRLQELDYVAGVARVLVRWERRREKLQPEVIRAVRRLLSSRILRDMLVATKKWMKDQEEGEKGRREEGERAGPGGIGSASPLLPFAPSPLLSAHAEEQILSRLEELRAFEPCLADPQDKRQHHAMRIAAKRLRYTVEICRPMYAGRADGVLESIKQVQSLLGDIHDCDVWMDQLDAFSARQAKRFQVLFGHSGPLARVKAGIDYLRQDRRKRREELFATLTQFWRGLTREGLWEGLAQTVHGWQGTGDGPRAAGDGDRDDGVTGGRGDGVKDEHVVPTGSPCVDHVTVPGPCPPSPGHPLTPSPPHPLTPSSRPPAPATRHALCNPARN